MEGTKTAEHDPQGSKEHVAWYAPELSNISGAARKLLEEYSGVPPEQVVPHVLEVVGLVLRSSEESSV